MWYEGVAEDGSRSIGIAVSQDGKSGWKRHDRSAKHNASQLCPYLNISAKSESRHCEMHCKPMTVPAFLYSA